jgi:peptidoglycan/LPS O-acetylase OafA/YrhL
MTISDKHVPELDGLRGIAILLVLVWHFTGMLVDPDQGNVQYLAWRYLIFGQSGVDLFFVLSGFLIIGILVDNRGCPNYFKTFYIRRALRILPPYLIVVGGFWSCVMIGLHYFDRQIPLWSLLTFTQNWVMASLNTFGAMSIGGTWSLAIEEQFYLFAPALVLLLPSRLLPSALITVGLVSIIARSTCFYLWPENVFAPYVLTPLRLDGLCVGGLIAIAYRNPRAWEGILSHRKVLLVALGALAAAIPFYTWFLRSSLAPFVLYHFGHSYLAFLYGTSLTVILVWSGAPALAWLRTKSLTGAGLVSYSLYLFHPTFKGLFFVLAHRGAVVLQTPLDAALLAAAFVSTFVFCAVLRRYVERPAQELGKRFKYDEPRSAVRNAVIPVGGLGL